MLGRLQHMIDDAWARLTRRTQAKDPAAPNWFWLGGQRFEVVRGTTAEQDFWVASRLRAAGLDRVELARDETPEAFARRLLEDLVDEGAGFAVLAGLVVPLGSTWSPTLARSTEATLRGLRAAADKAVLRTLMATLVSDFFVSGLSSAMRSQSSSPLGDLAAPSPSSIAEPRSGASGLVSSGSWAGPIPNAGGP